MVAARFALRQAGRVTGTGLLALILLSMAWLFFLAGAAINLQAWRRSRPGVPVLPGVVGSLAVFFTLPWFASYGVEVPWPWLWILAPLALDPGCLARLAASAARMLKR
jgi:hypothetical protein